MFLTDVSGTVVWRGEYLPFGEVFSEDKDPDGDGTEVVQPFRFPGQYEDAETGLYYNYFRDYDPQIGRYVEADPIGMAGGVNLWGYANNNSLNFIDLFGLLFILDKSDETLYWIADETGWDAPPVISWPVVTGPYKKGPAPDGWYYLTGEEIPAPEEKSSMTDTCEEPNVYKFRLHPQFETDRSGLLLHPDGGVVGTAGCLGAQGCTESLRNFVNSQTNKPIGRRGDPNLDRSLPVFVRE